MIRIGIIRKLNRPQVVSVAVYLELVYDLPKIGAVSNVMSIKFAKKLNLNITPTKCRIVVASGTSIECKGVVSNVLSAFGSIDICLKLLVVQSTPVDIIIVDLMQI